MNFKPAFRWDETTETFVPLEENPTENRQAFADILTFMRKSVFVRKQQRDDT